MKIDEFIVAIRRDNVFRPGSHLLAPGMSDDQLSGWCALHKGVRLPADYLELLRRHNGLTIWPSVDSPDGTVRLLSVGEIEYAPRILFSGNRDLDHAFPATWFALSTDSDATRCLMVDLKSGTYMSIEPSDLEPKCIARGIEELLDWLCELKEEDRPRFRE